MNVVLYKRIGGCVPFFRKADLKVNGETTRENTGIYKKREKRVRLTHLTIAFGDLCMNLLLVPFEEYLCAGPG
jgi:hypothetical protein